MRPILAMAAAAILWSTGGLLIKVISLDAVSLAAWRSAIATVTLFVLARFRGHRLGVQSRASSWVAAIAYANVLLFFVWATKLTTAANAIFLQYTAPLYLLLLEPALLKTRLQARDFGYVCVALAGLFLFFTGRMDTGDRIGNLVALASGVFFAVFALAIRVRHDDAEARWNAVAYGNAVLCIGIAAFEIATRATIAWPTKVSEVAGIVYLGVVQIGFAYALFAYAISKLSALESTLVGMIEPILNPLWVFLGTGERPTPWAILGATFIVGSIVTRTAMARRGSGREAGYDAPAPS
jgi:drug/metabolite transporter, DME family